MTRDRIAESYDGKTGSEVDQRLVRERIHWMCARVAGREVADVGCGAGVAAVLLGREGCNVVGVDRDAAVLREAERRLAAEDDAVKGRIRLTAADAADLPFSDEAFDTVLLGNVLDEQLDRARVVVEVARVVRPDGRLVVTVPYGLVADSPYDAMGVRELLDLLLPEFTVDELQLIDRHVAVVATKGSGELSAELATQALQLAERRIHDIDIQVAILEGAQRRAREAADAGAEQAREQAEQLGRLTGERDALAREAARHGERLATLEGVAAERQRALEELRGEMREHERALAERDARIAELESARSARPDAAADQRLAEAERKAKTARQRLKERATESDRRLQARDLHVAAVESENEELRKLERDTAARIHAAEAALEAALAETDRAKLDRHLLEIEAAGHARHVGELQAIEADLRERVEQLEADLHAGRRERAGLAAERDVLRSLLDRTREEIERSRSASIEAREAAACAEARAERFERELSRRHSRGEGGT
jgi:SAM-dependent methyltransferase